MLLSKITINNFRLIVNAELDVHRNITLIVGRNNTAKTSCMSILEKVVKNKVLSYNDYPLQRRKYAFILLAQFMRKKITYEQLCKRLPLTSIEFLIDSPHVFCYRLSLNLQGLSQILSRSLTCIYPCMPSPVYRLCQQEA